MLLGGRHRIAAGWCSSSCEIDDEQGSPSRLLLAMDRDPCRDLVYAFLELFVACVILVTVTICGFTNKLIRFFDLPHPWTFLGHNHDHYHLPGGSLCDNHRRLAQMGETCVECLRGATTTVLPPLLDSEPGCHGCRVVRKAPGWKDIQDVNDATTVASSSDDADVDGSTALVVKAGGERCVKRKFAKIFQDIPTEEFVLPEYSKVSGSNADGLTKVITDGSTEDSKGLDDEGGISLEVELEGDHEDEEAETQEPKEADDDVSVEGVKAAFQVERDKLNALYSELEEERNASAVAANQAMAMITRLQEEKAAVQMEARQYQRMVEEKADYDQEAITLLREILFKREQEKFVLEKEVEIYRQRLLEPRSDDLRRPDDVLLLEASPGSEVEGRNLLRSFEMVQEYSPNSVSFSDEEDRQAEAEMNRAQSSVPHNGELQQGEFNADDMRTSSMVLRDNFRLAMEEDIKELTSRLQVLEDDRQLLKQIVQSLRAEKQELREIAHHLRELRLSSSGSKAQPVSVPVPVPVSMPVQQSDSSSAAFYQAKKRRMESSA